MTWKPIHREEFKEQGHWIIGVHEIILSQRITEAQKYPWSEKERYNDFRGECKTCLDIHSSWVGDKNDATRFLEEHIESYERSAHATQVLEDVKIHANEVRLDER